MKYYSGRTTQPKSRSRKSWLFVLLPLLLIAGVLYWLLFGGHRAEAPQQEATTPTANQEETPAYEPVDLQPVINAWVAQQTADYSIVVYDTQSKSVIGSNEPERELFAASLYKLFVAYLALIDFQTGAQDPDEIILAGQTRRECVDKMIRSSDSPCGETMMADMGQSALNERVAALGTKNTFFNGIRTSASDTALVLRLIIEKRDLNEENTAFLRDAMRTQDARYKRGLQTGAPEAIWDTKVGWNEDINYHDVGIMTLPDGRQFVVAILGQGSGASAPIADFARTVYSALTDSQ